MNKIDAFFTMASLLLIWIFAVFLVPLKIMAFVYVGISVWWVGTSIGRLPAKLAKQTDKDFLNAARDSNKKLLHIAESQSRKMHEMLQLLKRADLANKVLLSEIDQLMFEYCPEEMMPQQIANYEAHQRVATKEEEEEIERALATGITETQYKEMMAETEKLVSLDPEKTSKEGRRLEILATRIECYEKLHFPIGEDEIERARRH